MRITSGFLKGRRLELPETVSFRPTSEKVRQALCNSIQTFLENAYFLDICAGSGAVGIEALSRGALHSTFIEQGKEETKILLQNIHNCDIEKKTRVCCGACINELSKLLVEGVSFHIIYFDPPYAEKALIKEVFSYISDNPQLLAPQGDFFIELATDTECIFTSTTLKEKKRHFFGDTQLIHFEKTG